MSWYIIFGVALPRPGIDDTGCWLLPGWRGWRYLGPASTIRAAGFCQGGEAKRGPTREDIRNARRKDQEEERKFRDEGCKYNSKPAGGAPQPGAHPSSVPHVTTEAEAIQQEQKRRRLEHVYTNDLLQHATAVEKYKLQVERLKELVAMGADGEDENAQKEFEATKKQYRELLRCGPPPSPQKPEARSTSASSSAAPAADSSN